MRSAGGREDVSVKGQDTRGMVDADGEIALLAAVHDELFNHGRGHLEGVGELSQVQDKGELDGLVDLRELLEEAGQDDLLQRQNVLLHVLVGTDLGQDGRNLLADGQGVEVNLENVVQLTDFGSGALEEALAEGILEENGASRGRRHAEEVGQTRVLVLPGFVDVDEGAAGARSADDGNRKSGKEDKGSGLGEVGLGDVGGVVLLLALTRRDQSSRLAKEVVVSAPGGGVEEVVLADKEDAGQLFKVV